MPRYTRGDVSGSVSEETAKLLGADYEVSADDEEKAPAKKTAAKKSSK